jgi:serine/threonine protein kinase
VTTAPTDAMPQQLRGVLLAGTKLRNYEIVSILGQGGFGVTYRARDTTLGREVAIKEYLPTALAVREGGTTVIPRSTDQAEAFTWGRDRFVDEARTLARLDRALAIVRVYDFLEANGTAYMVMALLQGETLAQRLKRAGPLSADAIERLLSPLLDGLDQVHAAGFLHRDIKPDNILLDAAGNPTLIDFGASRASIAGRTTAMTAVFTPGYAAAEQSSSAKQGPWTDIYGLSATLYHAITGAAPSSAFDRMLDDEYAPLAKLRPAGFSPGLLIGVDAGLAVRASDRPQTITGWRAILSQSSAPDALATVVLARQSDTATVMLPSGNATVMLDRSTDSATIIMSKKMSAKRRGGTLWMGLAALAAIAIGGGAYYFANATRPISPQSMASAPSSSTDDAARSAQQAAAERSRQQEQAELARKQRADAVARDKAEAEAVLRHQVEEETRRKIESELAEKQQLEEEAKQAAEAEAAAKRKAEEQVQRAAEAGEIVLRLGVVDRQHIQVALTAVGFNTNSTNGIFNGRARDMISAWQKARNDPATGYLTAAENQALLKDASPAIAKFDDEQKKVGEEAKKKVDEDKAKAATAAKATAPPPGGAFDGTYAGVSASMNGSRSISIQVTNGSGSGAVFSQSCGPGPVSITISQGGAISGTGTSFGSGCSKVTFGIQGRAENGRLNITLKNPNGDTLASLARQGN